MNETPQTIETASAPPPGYKSSEGKRELTLTVGIMAAAFMFGQAVLPALLFMGPFFLFFPATQILEMAEPETATGWKDQIWYTSSSSEGTALCAFRPGQVSDPQEVLQLPRGEWTLLPSTNELWLISENRIGKLSEPDQSPDFLETQFPGNATRPFLYQGRPAVIEAIPSDLRLRVFDGRDWETGSRIDLERYPDSNRVRTQLQILGEGDGTHLFLALGRGIYYQHRLQLEAPFQISPWITACPRGSGTWRAFSVKGRPTIALSQHRERGGWELAVFGPGDDGWRRLGGTVEGWREFGVASVGNRYLLLGIPTPNALEGIVFQSGERVGTVRFGPPDYLLGGGLLIWLVVPQTAVFFLPALLAFVLTPLMAKHRVTTFRPGPGPRVAQYATLSRRAVAQFVDGIIGMAPAVVALVWFFQWFFELRNKPDQELPTEALGAMLVGFLLWPLLWFLTKAWLEGRSGWSPGKRLLGIRVLRTNLDRCGFIRGILRNLFLIVDGFLGFLVGVISIAISEKWQRIGDMVADTIVVESGFSKDLQGSHNVFHETL